MHNAGRVRSSGQRGGSATTAGRNSVVPSISVGARLCAYPRYCGETAHAEEMDARQPMSDRTCRRRHPRKGHTGVELSTAVTRQRTRRHCRNGTRCRTGRGRVRSTGWGGDGHVKRRGRDETGHEDEAMPVRRASCRAPSPQRPTEREGDGEGADHQPVVVGRDVVGRHCGCLAEEGDLRVGLVDEQCAHGVESRQRSCRLDHTGQPVRAVLRGRVEHVSAVRFRCAHDRSVAPLYGAPRELPYSCCAGIARTSARQPFHWRCGSVRACRAR